MPAWATTAAHRLLIPVCKNRKTNYSDVTVKWMEMHMQWWKTIWQAQIADAERPLYTTSVLAEHGPKDFGYQQWDPKTGKALANIWYINHWIHRRVAKVAGELGFASSGPLNDLVDPEFQKTA